VQKIRKTGIYESPAFTLLFYLSLFYLRQSKKDLMLLGFGIAAELSAIFLLANSLFFCIINYINPGAENQISRACR